MKSRFLKVRMPAEVYMRLKDRAAEAGKPISTFACALLETDDSKAHALIQLSEINSQLQELTVLLVNPSQPKTNNETLKMALHEILLIVRELAIERNAQILSKVSLQLKSQFTGVKHE